MEAHPGLAISASRDSLEDAVRLCVDLQVNALSISATALEQASSSARSRLNEHGISVTYVTHGPFFSLADPTKWQAQAQRIQASVDLAADVGSHMVIGHTGAAISISWEAAAAAFRQALMPSIEYARTRHVSLMIENTNALNQAVSFLSTLRDAIALAELCDIYLCVDYYNSWRDREANLLIAANLSRIPVVQLSDYLPTLTLGDRAVPGDGIMPIGEIIRALATLRYSGLIEMEIMGPRIDGDGRTQAFKRGVDYLSDLLSQSFDGDRIDR